MCSFRSPPGDAAYGFSAGLRPHDPRLPQSRLRPDPRFHEAWPARDEAAALPDAAGAAAPDSGRSRRNCARRAARPAKACRLAFLLFSGDFTSCRILINYTGNLTKHCSFNRSEEHTSELQSLMRISYAVFCLQKKKYIQLITHH